MPPRKRPGHSSERRKGGVKAALAAYRESWVGWFSIRAHRRAHVPESSFICKAHFADTSSSSSATFHLKRGRPRIYWTAPGSRGARLFPRGGKFVAFRARARAHATDTPLISRGTRARATCHYCDYSHPARDYCFRVGATRMRTVTSRSKQLTSRDEGRDDCAVS